MNVLSPQESEEVSSNLYSTRWDSLSILLVLCFLLQGLLISQALHSQIPALERHLPCLLRNQLQNCDIESSISREHYHYMHKEIYNQKKYDHNIYHHHSLPVWRGVFLIQNLLHLFVALSFLRLLPLILSHGPLSSLKRSSFTERTPLWYQLLEITLLLRGEVNQ